MTLDTYLKTNGEDAGTFAERAGIHRTTVQRIKKAGARSANVIHKVVAATGGAVTEVDLLLNFIPEKKRRRRKSK